MVGNTYKVLVEGFTNKSGILQTRTSGNIIVEVPGDESLISTFQTVKITEARNWILRGQVI